ncbi:hypothetical protein [Enterococcus pingfangensis]|uniref:hypothetical protein n=1 Tax=Enterococcus pingfangensis TaxID=2559924 RepID=UPI0010F4AF73|nr:hypothetical protein [Enterococcus pingfangensis]
MEIETNYLDYRNYPDNKKLNVLSNTIDDHKSAAEVENYLKWNIVSDWQSRQQLKCCTKSEISLFVGLEKTERCTSFLVSSLRGDVLCRFA